MSYHDSDITPEDVIEAERKAKIKALLEAAEYFRKDGNHIVCNKLRQMADQVK